MSTINLESIIKYAKLLKVEKEIKKEKERIKKEVKDYLNTENLEQTDEIKGMVARIEEKQSFSLDYETMKEELPTEILDKIRKEEVDMTKAKREFLDGNIPTSILERAEYINTTNSFHVRNAESEQSSNKKKPFWRL